MITEQRIKEILSEHLEKGPYFLVDLQIKPTNKIFIEVESDHGISIDECVKVSRLVEGSLDRDEEDFELMVSSPGVSKPIKLLRQYPINIGRNMLVQLKDSTEVEGKLIGVKENQIEIAPKQKKKKEEIQNLHINFSDIKQSKVLVSFN